MREAACDDVKTGAVGTGLYVPPRREQREAHPGGLLILLADPELHQPPEGPSGPGEVTARELALCPEAPPCLYGDA